MAEYYEISPVYPYQPKRHSKYSLYQFLHSCFAGKLDGNRENEGQVNPCRETLSSKSTKQLSFMVQVKIGVGRISFSEIHI